MISQKYRNIHPSFLGKVDINVSSNSDVGMSGAFTPFVELFDRFYFDGSQEPCSAAYDLEKMKEEYYESQGSTKLAFDNTFHFDSLEDYLKFVSETFDKDFSDLKYEKIEIVEKEPDALPAGRNVDKMQISVSPITKESLEEVVSNPASKEEPLQGAVEEIDTVSYKRLINM